MAASTTSPTSVSRLTAAATQMVTDMVNEALNVPTEPSEEAVIALLESRQVPFTTWDGWNRLDEYERGLGAAEGRDRKKVVERHEMLAASEPDKVAKS